MVSRPSSGKLPYTHFEDICEIMKAYDVSFRSVTAYAPGRWPMPMMPRSSVSWRHWES